ncbi:hypothetical protein [Salimicrobium halophilum]|uniref:DUF4083 domain-containing protein n=1 Tax=Salimicrobium halophilum TaxID=86666 RepID=A0A1G8REX3_9BACI|nr:hypothetical protein [Salimicrobium halophilum]SDJ14910.1 hypothetical protein SAMN04490247_0963 [Salimicrobium halophilum]
MDLLMSTFLMFFPIIIVAFLIRWVRLIKINSDKQVEQNKRIISLLEKAEKEK